MAPCVIRDGRAVIGAEAAYASPMAQILLFHHARGLTEGVRALAEEYQAQQAQWEAKVADKKARKAAAKAAREAQQ